MAGVSLLWEKVNGRSDLRGEVIGGLVSAGVAIPLAMGYGMFAFVVLGDEYFPEGAIAGLITAVVVGIVCATLGDKSANVYAPRVTTTFFIGILLYGLAHSNAALLKSGGLVVTLSALFALILLAGVFQALFGLTRLGTVLKFIPQPVMSGFQNAAALLLFLIQLGNVFGFPRSTTFVQALKDVEHARPLSVLIALVAMVAMWQAGKRMPRIPALFVGLGVGTVLYYALGIAGLGLYLGPTIGSRPFTSFEVLNFPNFVELAKAPGAIALLPTLVGGALALAIVASIDALLCSKLLSRPGDPGIDGDRLLVRLGVANAIAGGIGAITGGLNLGPSRDNKAFGGRSPVSALVNAAAVLLTAVAFFPALSYIPCVALSAVIMVIAIQHVDPWTVSLGTRVASRVASRKAALDLMVIVVVAALSVAIDIVFAVFVGIALAALLFLVRMSRSVIRRVYRCTGVRSRKRRTVPDMELLERSGATILAVELQGALFFGSGERLAAELAAQLEQDTRYVVLDLRRITEVDSTGSQILLEINAQLASRGKHLLVSVVQPSDAAGQLVDAGVLDAVGKDRVFRDLDRAIGWAEDDLLRADGRAAAKEAELPLGETSMASGFTRADLAAVEERLERREYAPGEELFREGAPGDELFIIVRGSASAFLRQGSGDIRLVGFGPGTAFGELAILDAGPRSATVLADGGLVCYALSRKGFAELSEHSPATAIRLLGNLGRLLSHRLRDANRTIQQLEE
jgi:MFS superfamily sulfate permease-like transporter